MPFNATIACAEFVAAFWGMPARPLHPQPLRHLAAYLGGRFTRNTCGILGYACSPANPSARALWLPSPRRGGAGGEVPYDHRG